MDRGEQGSIVVLGSTGSIGQTTLQLAHRFQIPVEGLVAGENWELLNRQIAQFKPRRVAVKSREVAQFVEGVEEVLVGEEGILELLRRSSSKKIVNGLVGEVGFWPTLEGLKLGKEIGLANKESLVIGGGFLKGWIEKGAIFPLDSEHFALYQLLKGRDRGEVAQLIVTASGGGIRDLELEKIPTATPAEVLNHPNWEMGAKITVDSATIVNKLFEVLEAYWLFGVQQVEGVIERNSLVHGGVQWKSGELSLHLSPPDMALPIGTFLVGEGVELVPPPQLPTLPPLSFHPIEVDRYPLWRLKPLLLERPQLGVVLNTLDDHLVPLFLAEKIGFGRLLHLLEKGVLEFQNLPPLSRVEEIGEVKGRVLQWLFSRIGKEV